MAYTPAVRSRLINEIGTLLGHDCPFCLSSASASSSTSASDEECEHVEIRSNTPQLQVPQFRPGLYRSAPLSDRLPLKPFAYKKLVSAHSKSPINTPSHQALRRRSSPTDISLRDLLIKQAHLSVLRKKQSDEDLQRIYDEQVLAYLDGPVVSLDQIED